MHYFLPSIDTQKNFQNPMLAQYLFLFSTDNCPNADAITHGALVLSENSFIACMIDPLSTDMSIMIRCLGYPNTFQLVTNMANATYEINSPDCASFENFHNKFSVPVTVSPALPGDCHVTYYQLSTIGDYCQLP